MFAFATQAFTNSEDKTTLPFPSTDKVVCSGINEMIQPLAGENRIHGLTTQFTFQ